MTETEKKALALVNEVKSNGLIQSTPTYQDAFNALCRAIEQHEAYKQEVSDAVEASGLKPEWVAGKHLCRFIIAKPDPLVEALEATGDDEAEERAWRLRAALAARGLEVRKIGEGD